MRTSFALIALVASALSTSALAEEWLPPAKFQAMVEGKATVVADAYGDSFGTEYFLPGRRVIWQYSSDKSCLFGTYAPQRDAICYTYDTYDGGLANCLRYRPDGAGLAGVEWNDGIEGETFTLTITDSKPPNCPGS